MKEGNNIVRIEDFKQRRKEKFCAEMFEAIEKLDKIGYWQDSSIDECKKRTGNIIDIEEGRK
ncbi:MAG: hypothetical protein PHH12_02470 [Candidatus Shapirobacteria bacterium]|jgi:hypothetical protein|nr:hypothetical protein [Candidatus Shapirobacteria bacterium]